MVVPPGNEGSDGPQLTSPVPGVAPARNARPAAWRRGPAGGPTVSSTGRGRSGNGCAPSTAATPPYVDLVLAAGLFVLCSGWVVERTAHRPNLWFVGGPGLPAGLPAPGADDRLPRHRRGGVRPVARRPARLADAALLVALYTVALESDWVLVVAASAILETGVVMATVRWTPTGNDVESLRLPDRAGLHRPAGRGRGPRPAQPARLAGRTRRAAGARARPAGVAGRGGRAGPHRAGDARRRLAQHPGDGDPGRRRRRRRRPRPGPGGRGHARGVEHRTPGADRHASDARRAARRAGPAVPADGRRTARPAALRPPSRAAARACASSMRSSTGCGAPDSTSRSSGGPALRGLAARRADRLPHRAGGADQRPEARRGARPRSRSGWTSTTPTSRCGSPTTGARGGGPVPGSAGRRNGNGNGKAGAGGSGGGHGLAGHGRAGHRLRGDAPGRAPAGGGWEVSATLRDCKAPPAP